MKNEWFISDTHFGHANMLNFKDENGVYFRGQYFNTVEEMDEHIVSNWNKDIRPKDTVIHLGDVFFRSAKHHFANNILPRLNGNIRVILGNHDDGKYLASLKRIEKVSEIRRYDIAGFICSHSPRHKESNYNWRKQKYLVNVHGHTHVRDVEDIGYINICVEKTNYSPIHYDDLVVKVEEMSKLMENI